jgi:hypothetical protein
LYTSKVTDAQLRAIRQVIRSSWGIERKKPLTEDDQQILDIVQRLRGVPKDKGHGEHKAFFEQVQQEFNAWAVVHGYKPHTSWKATRNKYARLHKRMQPSNLYMQAAPHSNGA